MTRYDAARRTEILYETTVRIARDTISLRLWGRKTGTTPFVLEHQITQHGDVVLSQLCGFSDRELLTEFRFADPYGDHLRLQYHALSERLETSTVSQRVKGPESGDREIHAVQACANEGEVFELTSAGVREMGGENYLYRWIQLDEKTGDVRSQRTMLGCHPGWMHKYIQRLWYMNDPMLEYAKRNVSPVTTAELDIGKDHWAHTDAPRFGFKHVALFPVHLRTGWIGVLQVAGADDMAAKAMTRGERRSFLRNLATELLDWEVNNVRNEAESQFVLTAQELDLLRIVRAGGNATNVAACFGLSTKAVYKAYADINDKLKTKNIARSYTLATEKGLLD